MLKKVQSMGLLTWLFVWQILLLLGTGYFILFIANETYSVLAGIFGITLTLTSLFILLRNRQEEEKHVYHLLDRIDKIVPTTALKSVSHLNMNSKETFYSYIESVLEYFYKNELKIEEVNKVNEKFLMDLSREIRTPLYGIMGYLQLLNETSLDEEQRDCLSNIKQSSEVLLTEISNILCLSKINDEMIVLNKSVFDIFEKVESVVEKFSRKAELKNIILGVCTDPTLHRYLMGDSEKIVLVLINLIDNAIKYTPIGGTISLFVRGVESNGDLISINFAVQDNRIGIDKSMQMIIFGSLVQTDIDLSEEYRGYDTGLAASSKMVDVMGGKLEIESAKDEGATFSFTLMLQIDQSSKMHKQLELRSLKVGLALPDRSIYRDVDMFLEEYVRTLHANFSTYYYDDLFGAKGYKVLLPDVMIFDHRYARRKGYLNTIQSLDCNIVLVTTHDLKRQINQYIHKFESIILSPLTLDKTRNVLEQFYKKEKELWVKRVEEKTVAFENTEVLVVEDNQINQKLIKAVLERFNVNVTLASNGLEALDVIEKNRFDLVFMDIEMPVMDGVEATKKILQYEVQNRLEHVPIVALTANAVIGDQERYMRAGVDHYLSKPIRLQKLQYVLEKYLKEED